MPAGTQRALLGLEYYVVLSVLGVAGIGSLSARSSVVGEGRSTDCQRRHGGEC